MGGVGDVARYQHEPAWRDGGNLDEGRDQCLVKYPHALWSRIAVCTAMLAIAVLDARATDELLKYPDFSGQWGRDMLFFEPPPSGPGPIVNSVRKADGTMVPLDACCGIV